MSLKESVGAVLKRIRIEQQLSQTSVAEQVGITKSGLSLIESGKSNCSVETISNICQVLNVKASDVFEEAEK